MNEEAKGLTEEMMFNIKRGLASAVHLAAVKLLAEHVRQSPEGLEFLQQWAQERREEATKATAKALSPEMSMLLGDMKRDVVEEMLKELEL